MDYDEDDLDYASDVEEFHEDSLSNEEYDKLHEMLPQLRAKLAGYNDEVPELDLKEALYYNYYELPPAIDEIKAKFKKNITMDSSQTTTSEPMQPRPSKLAQLSKHRSIKNESSPSQTSAPSSVPKQGKLAALASIQARSKSGLAGLVKNESSKPNSVAILDKLHTETNADNEKSKTKLSSLLSSRSGAGRVITNHHKKDTVVPTRSVLEPSTVEKSPAVTPPPTVEPALKSAVPKPIQKNMNNIAYDDSILIKVPRASMLGYKKRAFSEEISSKKRRRSDIFRPLTNIELNVEKISKAAQNFQQPSPDDKVLEAQKSAFENKLGSLQISEPEPKKAVKPTKPTKKIDLVQELAANYSKPHKSFVVIGHVDAGKSTLMGRMLLDFGIVDAKTVNKLVREAEKAGKGSFALAWVMDQTSEERAHGVTVDICATDFETPTTRFTAIDAPGHKDFVPQMIGGVSQADFALLVVDSITGEFESGFAMDGQTKEHTILAKNLGIEKVCVVVNKMDKENWDQLRYETISNQLTEYLTSEDVGFDKSQLEFIPASGLTGVNVINRESRDKLDEFKWYSGPTLGEYLENVELSKNIDGSELLKEDFYLSVHDMYKDKGELKVSGKVSSGVIQVGETIVSSPSGISLAVQGIVRAQKKVDFAISGELVQLIFKASHVDNDQVEAFKVGDLVSKAGSPVKSVNSLTANIHLFNMSKPLLVGTPFVLFRNNCSVPARITKLVEITSGKKKKKLLHLVSKQSAIVEIEVQGSNLLPLTTYEDNKVLGRVVIRREGTTIGAGTVISA